MRIKEVADLTGSTVRTIRYYHQIGLLPIPPVRHGSRDYDMVHIARFVRIRWLARAGIPLASVAAVLGEQQPLAGSSGERPDTVLTDLRATVAALDEQLDALRSQREHINRLITSVERDGRVSPMPAAMVRFYDQMEQRAADEQIRREVRRERDFMELAFYRGDMPPEAAIAYEGLTQAELAESERLFGAATDGAGGRPLEPREIEELAAATVDRVTRWVGPDLPRVFQSIDLDVARRAAELWVRTVEPRKRPACRAVADALLAAIEKGQAE